MNDFFLFSTSYEVGDIFKLLILFDQQSKILKVINVH